MGLGSGDGSDSHTTLFMTKYPPSVKFGAMQIATDFAARGKVTAITEGKVVFNPSNTNYQIQLSTSRPFEGPIGQLILVNIRAKARKIYTVPSGGGFISPLFGPPKLIQGRAAYVDPACVVIRAGFPVIVEIPASDDGLDLSEGQISVGSIVNAVPLPGMTMELVQVTTPA